MKQNKLKRAKYLRFTDFALSENVMRFSYIIDGEKIVLESQLTQPSTLPNEIQKRIMKNIGMVYVIDLAEVILPQEIIIDIPFSKERLSFWQDVFWEIARERQYIKKLDLAMLSVPWRMTQEQYDPPFSLKNSDKAAVLSFTGGKESLAALKFLEGKMDLLLMSLDPHTNIHRQKAIDQLQSAFQFSSILSNRKQMLSQLEHQYDGKLASGFDMGHLTFNAMLYGNTYRYVLMGNEYGSNFPNTYYQGFPINHQYVKTIDLAKKMNDYIHTFITKDFSYSSPFFGLYEYKIAEYFFADEKYLSLWTSCNNATDKKNFCEDCPKCAFSYLLGLVYKDKQFLKKYFQKDMLRDAFPLFKDLMDFTSVKPLECVGEKKEVWVALYKIYRQKKDFQSQTMIYFLNNIYDHIRNQLALFEKEITSSRTVYPRIPKNIEAILSQKQDRR